MKSFLYKILFISSCINILVLLCSVYSLQVLDRVLSSGSYSTLIWLTVLTLIFYAEISFLQYKRGQINYRMVNDIEQKINAKVNNYDAQERHHFNELLNKIKAFLIAPTGFINLCDMAWAIVFVIAIFFLHWVNGMIMLAAIGVMSYFSYFLAVASEMPKKRQNSALTIQNKLLSGLYTNICLIFTKSKFLHNIINASKINAMQSATQYNDTTLKSQNIITFLRSFFQTVLFASSATLVIQNEMTSGAIIAVSILSSKAIQPFISTHQTQIAIKEFLASRNVIELIINQPIEENKISQDFTKQANLIFSQVHVSSKKSIYNQPNKYVLRNIELQISQPEKIALVGKSGSGKTALLEVISGILKPDFGTISCADIELHSKQGLGSGIVSYLSANANLIYGDIIQNISALAANPDQNSLNEILQLANLTNFIASVKHDINLIDAEAKLPQGKKQQILLARTFLGWPKLILLENPHKNLDTIGLEGLNKLMDAAKHYGSIVIAEIYNIGFIKAFDKAIVMHDNTVQKYSSIQELLERK